MGDVRVLRLMTSVSRMVSGGVVRVIVVVVGVL